MVKRALRDFVLRSWILSFILCKIAGHDDTEENFCVRCGMALRS